MTEPRPNPQNVEAEQALLGALLVNDQAYWRVNDKVTAEDFYEEIHGRIFDEIRKCVEAGRKADPITLRPNVPDEIIEGVTGAQYLARLAGAAATVFNAPDYAAAIADLATRRRMMRAAENIMEAAADSSLPASDLIEGAETALHDATARADMDMAGADASTIAERVIVAAEKAHKEGGRRGGIATGMADLDKLVGPMLPGDLVVLGGATSSGKTALAEQIAWNTAGAGHRTAYVSLEMTAENLMARRLAQESRVEAWRIESGGFDGYAQFKKMEDARQRLAGLPLRIIDTPKPRFQALRSAVMREQRLHGLDFLIIDHLRFIRFDDPRAGLAEGTAQITGDCKALAKKLEIPILLLAQFNREMQKREIKRPQMSDLYGGAAIEQDADVVFFVHRDEYWLERAEPKPEGGEEWVEWQIAYELARGKADCILAKRRRGRGTGTCVLGFEANFTRFYSYQEDQNEGQGEMM